MTAKVIRISERGAESAEAPAEVDTRSTGWDPFEVWRTRVLLPRLEETDQHPSPPERPGKRSVLKRLRRTKKD